MGGPRRFSRHIFTAAFKDESGVMTLSDREPYRYRNLRDNRVHLCVDGDTLQHLAARYFKGIPNACRLWWVIADFQPTPIFDPTLALQAGSTLIIPSVRTVLEKIFNPARSREAVL